MTTVDILMATYNGERFIREQIESIQAQSYTDWRLLVSDDCSIDGTVSIVREIARNDPRIIIVSEGKRFGSAKENFMNLISYSDAMYAMFCDQDDVWFKEKIALFVDCISKDIYQNHPILCFSDMVVTDESLNILSSSFMKTSHLNPRASRINNLLALNCVPGCASMMNRSLIDIARRKRDATGVVMHDAWMAILASAIGSIVFLDTATSYYRQHGNNAVGAKVYSDAILKGLGLSDRRIVLHRTIDQAQTFLDVYQDIIPDQTRSIVEQYASLAKKSKLKRLQVCSKYKFWKTGLARIADQIVNM